MPILQKNTKDAVGSRVRQCDGAAKMVLEEVEGAGAVGLAELGALDTDELRFLFTVCDAD